MDQAVTADPVGAVQVRRRVKMYKALLGPDSAVYGDHVELSVMDRTGEHWREHGEDFASTVGTGAVVGTKFVWPEMGPHFAPVNLNSHKDEVWKKWIALYNDKMLSKGTFLNLYTYGYDSPEAYAIEKDGKMYYAFFAPQGAGRGKSNSRVESRELPRHRLRRREGSGRGAERKRSCAEAGGQFQGSPVVRSEALAYRPKLLHETNRPGILLPGLSIPTPLSYLMGTSAS
jgi:hypothetical protein